MNNDKNYQIIPNYSVIDDNGNTARLSRWGSEAAAIESLKTLKNCKNCVDCINCENCNECVDCRFCENCKNCGTCYGCLGCWKCYNSSDQAGVSWRLLNEAIFKSEDNGN